MKQGAYLNTLNIRSNFSSAMRVLQNSVISRVKSLYNIFRWLRFSILSKVKKRFSDFMAINKLSHSLPVLNKKKIAWELIARNTSAKYRDKFLADYPKIKCRAQGIDCEFYDLTLAHDYRFIVNGFECSVRNLTELAHGERGIVENSSYFSTSLIDKTHMGCSMFSRPFYLALEVDPDAILVTAPVDIGSVRGEREADKVEYAKQALAKRLGMDLREDAYHTLILEKTGEVPLPHELQANVMANPDFQLSTMERGPQLRLGKHCFYYPEELLRETLVYNEILVMGNRYNENNKKVKGSLLLVKKYNIAYFNRDEMTLLSTLEKRTNGRIKLAIIDFSHFTIESQQPVVKEISPKKVVELGEMLEKLQSSNVTLSEAYPAPILSQRKSNLNQDPHRLSAERHRVKP